MNSNLGIAEVKTQPFERRRARRYRYSAPICIRTAHASEIRAMSVEISETGASVITASSLKVGEIIELKPIGGDIAKAIVRRNVGKVYGLEFLCLTAAQSEEIRRMCSNLPAYWSNTVDVWKQ
jgi:c-di-GMP-binding flagellar brake protein YcgR